MVKLSLCSGRHFITVATATVVIMLYSQACELLTS